MIRVDAFGYLLLYLISLLLSNKVVNHPKIIIIIPWGICKSIFLCNIPSISSRNQQIKLTIHVIPLNNKTKIKYLQFTQCTSARSGKTSTRAGDMFYEPARILSLRQAVWGFMVVFLCFSLVLLLFLPFCCFCVRLLVNLYDALLFILMGFFCCLSSKKKLLFKLTIDVHFTFFRV